MVDPKRITRFDLTSKDLEEYLIFWIAVAGKPAKVIAPRIHQVFVQARQELSVKKSISVFKVIKMLGRDNLARILLQNGIGCNNIKALAMFDVATRNLDLRTCSRDELLQVHGIGLKTANCFIMHSRAGSRCAGLDTHILKLLRALGYSQVPKSTPGSMKQYERLESYLLPS